MHPVDSHVVFSAASLLISRVLLLFLGHIEAHAPRGGPDTLLLRHAVHRVIALLQRRVHSLAAQEQLQVSQRALADLELFLRSKRVHSTLQERYNPMYGMSEKERIRATARRVGLNVPKKE